MRFSRKDVERAFVNVQRMFPDWKLGLDCYSPGDGLTRYKVVRFHEHGQSEPFGATCWLGASEAFHGLWTIVHTVQMVNTYRGVTV